MEPRPPWYDRHAWILFALVALAGLVPGLGVLVDPASMTGIFDGFGHPLPSSLASDPAATRYLEFVFGWTATMAIGFDLFGLVVAATAFRRGARWAWMIFWYWPLMFLHHFLHYESAFRYAQLVWLTLTALALVGTAGRVWRGLPETHAVASTASTPR